MIHNRQIAPKTYCVSGWVSIYLQAESEEGARNTAQELMKEGNPCDNDGYRAHRTDQLEHVIDVTDDVQMELDDEQEEIADLTRHEHLESHYYTAF